MGYRGSGKSTVGRALAEHLGLSFVDTDGQVIAAFGGRSVTDIWAQLGEPAFREVEAEVIANVVKESGRVIALGGGSVNRSAAARAAVASCKALRVYLEAPAEVLAERIASDAKNAAERPSLTGKGSAADEVAEVLRHRERVYRSVADVVVDVSKSGIEPIVEAIVEQYEANP